jgi:hypothetical protein
VGGYDAALDLHLLSVVVLFGGITVFGVCYFQIRAAGSVAEATPWARLADRAGWIFPVAILGLLASGAYLTSDRWTWSTPWILASIAGLILVTLQGPVIAAPRSAALKHALDADGQTGALDARARRLARDRALWIVLLANPGIVLGITWNMIVKPGGAEAVAAIVVGYLAGVAAALGLTREAAPSA